MQRKPDLILGTAGHIDHGKSSLILALTGTDPDRLSEEKKRGITITLGFAQLALPDGRTMGVVDVPGHEKFVKQMIAGSTGIDVALLTIAADDGIMPQTVEHIAVLQTLGVPSCVVALTKTDLVDDDWIEFITGEIRSYLARTPYADVAIVPVSSKTGAGLDDLRLAIQKACKGVRPARQNQALRLAVDRSFTIKGAGTVVTGTLWSGSVHVGDEVELLPSGLETRVRSVQVHNQPVEEAQAGNRVALNLVGIKTEEAHPGDWVCAPGAPAPTDRFDAYLTYLDTGNTGKALKTGVRMHIAHGTKEVLGRVLLCDDAQSLAAGQNAYVQIRLEEPLSVRYLDRFVIRTYSPVQVAGGGTVLLARPRHRTTLSPAESDMLDALHAGDEQKAVESALALQREPVETDQLADGIGLGSDNVRTCLQEAVAAKHAIVIGGDTEFYTTQAVKQRMLNAIECALVDFHAENPQATGISKDALHRQCAQHCTAACFNALLVEAQAAGIAVVGEGEVGHPSARGAAQKAEAEASGYLLAGLQEAGTTPPTLAELARQTGTSLPVARKAMAALETQKAVRRLSSDLYYDERAVDDFEQKVIRYLRKAGSASAAQLRDVLGVSRKYAIPLLEHFDAIGITVRDGDLRTLNKP